MNATYEQVNALIATIRPIAIYESLREDGKAFGEVGFTSEETYYASIMVKAHYATEWPIGRHDKPEINVVVGDFYFEGDPIELTAEQKERIAEAVYGMIY